MSKAKIITAIVVVVVAMFCAGAAILGWGLSKLEDPQKKSSTATTYRTVRSGGFTSGK